MSNEDRRAILDRRARFVASALLAVSGCAGAPERPVGAVSSADAGVAGATDPEGDADRPRPVPSWREVLGSEPDLDTPADAGDVERGRFDGLGQSMGAIYDGLSRLEATIPETCPIVDASCAAAWSAYADEMRSIEIRIARLTPLCGFGSREPQGFVARAGEHQTFARRRLDLLAARVAAVTRATGDAAEQAWASEQGRAARATAQPCLSCVRESDVRITATVLFAERGTTVGPSSFAILDEVAQLLKARPGSRLLVLGHADASEGTAAQEGDLAARRAELVRAALVARGVDPTRIAVRGFGSSQPLDVGTTADGRAKNRRAAFDLLP